MIFNLLCSGLFITFVLWNKVITSGKYRASKEFNLQDIKDWLHPGSFAATFSADLLLGVLLVGRHKFGSGREESF